MNYKFGAKILLLTLLFYIAFIAYETMTTQVITPPTSQTKKSPKEPLWVYSLKGDKISHIIIGDSFVKNTYNNYSNGFASILNDELKESTQKEIVSNVFTQKAETIDEAFSTVQNRKILKLVPKANVITLSLGMEDFLPLLEDDVQNPLYYENMAQVESMFFENIQMLIEMIRSQNPKSLIIMYEIYFPLWFNEDEFPKTKEIVKSWNNELHELANNYSPAIVLPLSEMFKKNTDYTWTLNGTYPNDFGIELISEWALKEIVSTTLP